MQTVNEAKYTYWHTIIEIWQASEKSKEEWCWENKIPLKTLVHYEGIFRRQNARGYVYQKPVMADDTKKPTRGHDKKHPRTVVDKPVPEGKAQAGFPEKTESAYVEIPMPDETPEPKRQGKPVKPELVIQTGGCRLTLGGEIPESTLRSILKAVSGDA